MKTLDEGSPLVLTVVQTTDGIKVTEIQNGIKSATEYRFRGGRAGKNAGAQGAGLARIKKDTLILEYTMQELTVLGSKFRESVRERWTLSPDSNTLTIRSTHNDTQIYARQASLESALARAAEASLTNKCVCLRLPPGAPPPREYKKGAALGYTVFRRLNRCVIFDGGISGGFFEGLQRIDTTNGTVFRKAGQAIATFPEDVTLEISFWATFSYWPWDPFEEAEAPLPAEFFGLRFQVKWTGSLTRDLGELPSELLTEHRPEQRRPAHLYRIEVSAKGIPLDDNLEIRILTPTGTQIGCIRGNI